MLEMEKESLPVVKIKPEENLSESKAVGEESLPIIKQQKTEVDEMSTIKRNYSENSEFGEKGNTEKFEQTSDDLAETPVSKAAGYCTECGHPLRAGAKFCDNCGRETVEETIRKEVGHYDGYIKNKIKEMINFDGRLSRGQYVKIWLVLFFIHIILRIAMMTTDSFLGIIILLAITLPLCVFGVSVNVRRFHDLDRSGWYCLWLLIPIVNIGWLIYLLCKKGTARANNYGIAPLD
ncbi:MAG: DUF805 domain-containing protein [Schwartzia succinivorans]|nr:DUF805 domain-containing protein [Schwartzia succinivorans]